MNFLGVGVGELLLILVIAMLVVGPERMVEVAGQLGRMLAKFREQSDSITREFKEAFTLELDEEDAAPQGEVSEGKAAPASVGGAAAVGALPAGDGASPDADQATAPEVPERSPEESAAFEAAQLEQRLAADMVDGELEVTPIVANVEGDGAVIEDDDDAYEEIEPVDLSLAAVVPEDQDVEPTIVNDVLVIPGEDASAELPIEAEE